MDILLRAGSPARGGRRPLSIRWIPGTPASLNNGARPAKTPSRCRSTRSIQGQTVQEYHRGRTRQCPPWSWRIEERQLQCLQRGYVRECRRGWLSGRMWAQARRGGGRSGIRLEGPLARLDCNRAVTHPTSPDIGGVISIDKTPPVPTTRNGWVTAVESGASSRRASHTRE